MRKNLTNVAVSGLLLLIGGGYWSCQSPAEIRKEQMIVNGRELYLQHCANCHQADGSGLNKLYPPIAQSDFLKNKAQVICLMRYGYSGALVVNGTSYQQPMPANANLYDLDIAALTTYIYNEWGNEDSITETDSVTAILSQCSGTEQ